MGSNQSDRPRKVKAVVISDVHLGTYGCKARELNDYLRSIQPEILVLNGDIVDVWRFSKSFFPDEHFMTIRIILAMMAKGTVVYFIPGNHDEALRRFAGTKAGNFQVVNKLVLSLDGQKSWIFHGDVFDASITQAKWLAKLGGWGYDMLILINRFINWVLARFNKEPYSLSKKIKNNVKSAVKFITNFENVCVELAIENDYDYVICGHIHEPKIEFMENEKGEVFYLNSGDWIENLTALEYNNKKWKLYKHDRNLSSDENEYNFEHENKLAEQFIAVLKK